jgi:hypothetical protein
MKITIDAKPEIKTILKKLTEVKGSGSRMGKLRILETIEAWAKKFVPVRTSNLLHSISASLSPDGSKGTLTAGAKYARFVHEGTGLFGPYKILIKPKTKKALFWEGAPHPYRSVKGQKPNPFFLRAINQVDFQKEYDEGMATYLKRIG